MTTNEPTPYTKEEALKEAERCDRLLQLMTNRDQALAKKYARLAASWRLYAEMVEKIERLGEVYRQHAACVLKEPDGGTIEGCCILDDLGDALDPKETRDHRYNPINRNRAS